MWFLFGFVTLIVAVSFEFWRRHELMWSPDGKCQGYDYKFLKSKNRTTGLLFGTKCESDANFVFKQQAFIDAFFKRIGVSREFETGDSSFDDACYLATDCADLHQLLVSQPRVRDAIKQILSYSNGAFAATAIYCRQGRIWIRFDGEWWSADEGVEPIERKLGPLLSLIANAIADLTKAGVGWRDPFVYKAILVLAISSGFAINAAIQFYRTTMSDLPFLLYPKELAIDALIYSFVTLPVLVLVAVHWLGRGARTHLVLIELVTIGAFGLFASIAFEMRDVNIELDKTKPDYFETKIISKHVSKSRRSTSYSIVVRNWDCDCGSYSIAVSAATYNSASVSNPVMIAQRNGYLGYKWISAVNVYWFRQ
ncbi:hypothetical protein [Cellvibrio sp. pealriver]|uniref:hypothetical protein n=1 Tax=Cellvibrio sp. pealriver TaxID=1622269 RepID=UPI00066FCE65|nr:hypothetical protein [Cellvibrio sp. pealriver]